MPHTKELEMDPEVAPEPQPRVSVLQPQVHSAHNHVSWGEDHEDSMRIPCD